MTITALTSIKLSDTGAVIIIISAADFVVVVVVRDDDLLSFSGDDEDTGGFLAAAFSLFSLIFSCVCCAAANARLSFISRACFDPMSNKERRSICGCSISRWAKNKAPARLGTLSSSGTSGGDDDDDDACASEGCVARSETGRHETGAKGSKK